MKNLKMKSARVAKDLTQQGLADAIGVSRQTISAIEKGDYNPTINLCIAICKTLDKTLDQLFGNLWTSLHPLEERLLRVNSITYLIKTESKKIKEKHLQMTCLGRVFLILC